MLVTDAYPARNQHRINVASFLRLDLGLAWRRLGGHHHTAGSGSIQHNCRRHFWRISLSHAISPFSAITDPAGAWQQREILSGRRQPQICPPIYHTPANERHWNNVGLMLGQRLRRWPNIKPTLFQCVVFARTHRPTTALSRLYLRWRNNPALWWKKANQ